MTRRKPAAKGMTPLARKIYRRYYARPYVLPQLLNCPARPAAALETHCQSAIRAAWAAGEHGRVKAAREEIARWQMSPADIATMARSLADYNYCRPWPHGPAADEKVEWLYSGSGCCERIGTVRDAHMGAWSALSAALSILVDIPLEHPEDEAALLLTLTNTGWRHVPSHQQARVARRMARFVGDSIMGRPFVPGARAT